MHKLVKQKTLFHHFLNMSLVHWFPFRLLSIHIKVGNHLEAQFLRLFIFCPATSPHRCASSSNLLLNLLLSLSVEVIDVISKKLVCFRTYIMNVTNVIIITQVIVIYYKKNSSILICRKGCPSLAPLQLSIFLTYQSFRKQSVILGNLTIMAFILLFFFHYNSWSKYK